MGCGYATTSERLRQLGNRVTGIESSEQAVTIASRRLDRVIAADLQTAEPDETYDCVIFADVLEHLPRPEPVLERYLRFLKAQGSVIVSLPNVGLWSVRLSLLAGRALASLQMAVRWGTGTSYGLPSPINIANYADTATFDPIPPRLDPVTIATFPLSWRSTAA